jgi:hypothetical protein
MVLVHEEADAAGMPRLAFRLDKGANDRENASISQVRIPQHSGESAKTAQFRR